MIKEKNIEKSIITYLARKGAMTEGIQSGSVIIKKGKYCNKMNLQTAGCPDIICLYRGTFIGIEVKKSQAHIDIWLKQEKRFLNSEIVPKSYKREEDQARYKQKILANGGVFILTYELSEVIEYIEKLDKESKKDLTGES